MNALSSPDEFGALGLGASLGDVDFRAIAQIMMVEARISLPPQKATLVRSRLARRLRDRGLTSFADYIALVERDTAERRAMVEALTTNHTHFFREVHHFDHLREKLVPEWRGLDSHRPIRIWSSASSSGEEAYTIAMCLLGTDNREAQWARGSDIRILATDISTEMVEATRAASYTPQAADSIPAPYRKLWTHEHNGLVAMAEEPRAMVSALQLNLFDHWPMKRSFDAIFCRNVMIYFDDDAKIELETRLIDQLAPGGILYIGHSERLIGPARDVMVPCGQTIYRKPENMGRIGTRNGGDAL